MRPTVITGLADSTRCMQEEIFGQWTVFCKNPNIDLPGEVQHRLISQYHSNKHSLFLDISVLKTGPQWNKNLLVVPDIHVTAKKGPSYNLCWTFF